MWVQRAGFKSTARARVRPSFVEADDAGLVDLVWRYLVQGWKGKDIARGVDDVV
jgi:hypothetical protein